MAELPKSHEGPRSLRAVAPPRPGVLSLTIKDKNALYAAYMPFLKGGGIFVPSSRTYKLGEEVFMLLSLMESKEKIPVAGHVVWITPKGAQVLRESAFSSARRTPGWRAIRLKAHSAAH